MCVPTPEDKTFATGHSGTLLGQGTCILYTDTNTP